MKLKGKIIFIALPLVVVASMVVAFFVQFFDLLRYGSYQITFSAFLTFTIFIGILINLAEFFASKIDKNATLNTFFVSLFLLIFLLTSDDFSRSLRYLGVPFGEPTKIFVLYINPLISHLAFIFAAFFTLKFYEHDFGLHLKKRLFFFILGLLFIVQIFTHVFQFYKLSLIIAAIETIGVITYFSFVMYKLRNRSDFVPIELTYCIITILSLCYFYNEFSFYQGIHIAGVISILFIFIALCFIFIYLNFLVIKTKDADMLDEIKQKELELTSSTHIYATCFKTFDCFVNKTLLTFPSKKSKEFFALLVILRGKSLSMDKAITYLYPDKDIDKAKVSYRDVIWKLRKYFNEINFKGVSFRRGLTLLDTRFISCDYYDKLDNNKEIDIEEFLPEYDWSIELNVVD